MAVSKEGPVSEVVVILQLVPVTLILSRPKGRTSITFVFEFEVIGVSALALRTSKVKLNVLPTTKFGSPLTLAPMTASRPLTGVGVGVAGTAAAVGAVVEVEVPVGVEIPVNVGVPVDVGVSVGTAPLTRPFPLLLLCGCICLLMTFTGVFGPVCAATLYGTI